MLKSQIDSKTAETRISVAMVQNLCSHFICLKENEPTSFFEKKKEEKKLFSSNFF